MKIQQGSKVTEVVAICKTRLDTEKSLKLEAKTKAITKLVNIAEALKREMEGVSQETSMFYNEKQEPCLSITLKVQ